MTIREKLSALPLGEMEDVIRVLMRDMQQYYKRDTQGQLNDMMGYLEEWSHGRKANKRTGFSNLAHAGACLLFLMRGEA